MSGITNSGEGLAPVTYLPWVTDASARTAALGESADSDDSDSASEPPSAADIKAEKKAARRSENVAMHALTRRSMSVREMDRLLRSRGMDDNAVADEIARLESVGLLDDNALALDIIEHSVGRKGLGRQAIRSELSKRMIDSSAIDLALETLDSDDESERIMDIARDRAARLGSLDRDVAERRLSAFLARRGFRSSDISRAVREVLAERRPSGGGSSVRFI